MKYIPTIIFMFFIALAIPMTSMAKGIVPDCNITGATEVDTSSSTQALKYSQPCDFEMLITLINNVINFLLVYFATPLAAIIFAYAGFLLIFSSANEHNKSHAKGIIMKVVIGYVIALAAWLIINTILLVLGFDQAYSLLK